MLTTYRRVLARPHTGLMSATGVIARFPMSMMTLGIVILVSTTTGSYGLAGAVSAAYVIGNAVVAIPHGRLADRFGQARVLLADSLVFALAVGLLIRSVTHDWAPAWPYLTAALAGVSLPQVGSLVRARWASLLHGHPDLHTAFALEAIGDEIVFVAGPTMVTIIATALAPQSGLLVALVLGTVGSVGLALQTATEPPPSTSLKASHRGVMPWRRLLVITFGAAAIGSMFGAMEVATVAFAEHAGNKTASGYVLTSLSLGSLVAGFLAGAHKFRTPLLTRIRLGALLLAIGFVALPFITSLWLLAAAMFLIGFAVAPTLIAVVSFVEEIAPRARLTEAMGLMQSGLAAGIAPGTWGAGLIADAHGGAAAFWICVLSAVVATVCALAAD